MTGVEAHGSVSYLVVAEVRVGHVGIFRVVNYPEYRGRRVRVVEPYAVHVCLVVHAADLEAVGRHLNLGRVVVLAKLKLCSGVGGEVSVARAVYPYLRTIRCQSGLVRHYYSSYFTGLLIHRRYGCAEENVNLSLSHQVIV